MAASKDPFESYLLKAEALFQAGDVVQAGQIWQAILKKAPNHSDARAGLYKVKLYFDARATQDGLTPDQAMAALLPPVPSEPPRVSQPDEIERLLRDGCTLFDMGESQDALKKWEQILELEPGHQLAQAYVRDARRELGLEPADSETPGPETSPAPGPLSSTSPLDIADRVEKLLREGNQLYDLGMAEEATHMWQQVLELAPGHKDALTYLAMAERERSSAPPTALTREIPLKPPPTADLEPRLRSAESMLHLGRLEEAEFLYKEILVLAPHNFRALQGLHQVQGLVEARLHTHAAPPPEMYPPTPPMPWTEGEAAPQGDLLLDASSESETAPMPVQPPATLTAPNAHPRKGIEIPQLMRQLESEIPPWLKTPKFLFALVGGVVVLNVAFLWFRAHRKDVLLGRAVQDFRTSSQVPMARSLDIADLAESPAVLRAQAESLLEQRPLLAYYRGQELIRLNPLDGPAAQLMGRAGQLMAQSQGFGKGSAREVDKLLAGGDLDGARKMLLQLLQASPDDRELKARTGRVLLALTEIYALKERWGDAEDMLKEGRVMFASDKSWAARLQLLDSIKTLRAEERRSWISLLG